MRNICMVGTGYVGLVSGTCLADFGHQVICCDKEKDKIEQLEQGAIPFYEPRLRELVAMNVGKGRLSFSTDLPQSVVDSEVIFIAVGTPSLPDGGVDLSAVFAVAEEVAQYMGEYKVIVDKSTVPVGTAQEVKKIIREHLPEPVEFDVVSNPEFLREGSAVGDFMIPDRVIIGAETQRAMDVMFDIYRPLYLIETPMIRTNPETAELIKYASNAFLATKISFINEIANLCELVGADVQVVAKGMGLDRRIGPKFLHAGAGYGGSCFPKDTLGLVNIARDAGMEARIVQATIDVNQDQKRNMVDRVKKRVGDLSGKSIGVLGLSFKPNTDDMREAASLVLISGLLKEGAQVKAYDPVAMDRAREVLMGITYCPDPYEVARDVDALVLITEWNEFRQLDLPRVRKLMKRPIVIDGRNIYDPKMMEDMGFEYYGIGRGAKSP